MLAGKTLINYTSSFSPYKFGKNDDIALSYFKWTGYLKNQKQFVKTLKYCLFYLDQFLNKLISIDNKI